MIKKLLSALLLTTTLSTANAASYMVHRSGEPDFDNYIIGLINEVGLVVTEELIGSNSAIYSVQEYVFKRMEKNGTGQCMYFIQLTAGTGNQDGSKTSIYGDSPSSRTFKYFHRVSERDCSTYAKNDVDMVMRELLINVETYITNSKPKEQPRKEKIL